MNDAKRIIIAILITLLAIVVGFNFRAAITSDGAETARLANTAVKADNADRFNYAVDSRQGRIIAEGDFVVSGLVKFDEMTKQFAYVSRVREDYNTHTRTVCSGSGKRRSCHDETYKTWDYSSSDTRKAKTVKFYDREYPFSKFGVGDFEKNADTCSIVREKCSFGYYYADYDIRYHYRVVEPNLKGAFIAKADDGDLKPLKGDVISIKNADIKGYLADINNYKVYGNAFISGWLIILIAAAVYLTHMWVVKTPDN